ncbi:putative XRE-type DNA-binding protein [Variovorax boronicumulans]|uniref:helix-turn-helix transcriptional regulator n=1 Tax=Variovorax boronicumulans TaxID=436515 RepID=UPI0027839B81|nr:helix-turn-helix domain-containing protein [Variovorax boronicumulans]MDQ0035899.1 putative XRE-type DNA-binding protein [Variovorax boronicumulans]
MNWPELLQDLSSADMTQAQIASLIGVNQSTISDLATGRTLKPAFDTADKLRALHKRVQRRRAPSETKAGA